MTPKDETPRKSWIERHPYLTFAIVVGVVGLVVLARKRGAKAVASLPQSITEAPKSLVSEWIPLE
jgi:hypothetical protein